LKKSIPQPHVGEARATLPEIALTRCTPYWSGIHAHFQAKGEWSA